MIVGFDLQKVKEGFYISRFGFNENHPENKNHLKVLKKMIKKLNHQSLLLEQNQVDARGNLNYILKNVGAFRDASYNNYFPHFDFIATKGGKIRILKFKPNRGFENE